MSGYITQIIKIIRIGFFEGMGLGAKYGAVIGFVIGVVVWSIFRSFSGAGFFFGGLLGLSYGAVIGFIVGGGFGSILNLSYAAAQNSDQSSRFRQTAYAGGLLFGFLNSYLFGRLPLHWLVGALLGLVVTTILLSQRAKPPITFAERVMHDPDLLFGDVVYGIFGAVVGGLVGESMAGLLGAVDGVLLGALLGLAIACTNSQRKSESLGGPNNQLP